MMMMRRRKLISIDHGYPSLVKIIIIGMAEYHNRKVVLTTREHLTTLLFWGLCLNIKYMYFGNDLQVRSSDLRFRYFDHLTCFQFPIKGKADLLTESHYCIFWLILNELSVRTRRPEKCDNFAQRYQSQPITTKFQKYC